MPFTFPHFGSLKYVFESILHEVGRMDYIMPTKPNKRTAELGRRYSPEFVCTPFKITLGTFIESLDRGADELGMGGCNAYCRFGYYWPVQKLILEDLGYDFKFVPFDYENPIQIIQTFKRVGNNCSYRQVIHAFRVAWVKNRLTDLTDDLLYKYRAIEVEKGLSENVADRIYRRIVETRGIRNIKKFQREIPKIFANEIEVKKDVNPLRIVVNGEIYVVLEPSLNVDINRRLNDLGVFVETPITLRRFIDIGKKLNPFVQMHYIQSRNLAKKYIQYRLGGETQENIGDVVYYSKHHSADGIIHLYPFTCMPEIISRSMFPVVSKEQNMPVLSLVVDELTGEAGFQTRLEAFVDLLERKREIMENNKKYKVKNN